MCEQGKHSYRVFFRSTIWPNTCTRFEILTRERTNELGYKWRLWSRVTDRAKYFYVFVWQRIPPEKYSIQRTLKNKNFLVTYSNSQTRKCRFYKIDLVFPVVRRKKIILANLNLNFCIINRKIQTQKRRFTICIRNFLFMIIVNKTECFATQLIRLSMNCYFEYKIKIYFNSIFVA